MTAMPQPDGSQKAVSIAHLPGQGVRPPEGFHPWDFSPNSTMTNATVANEVSGVDGGTLNVKYMDGERKSSYRLVHDDRNHRRRRQSPISSPDRKSSSSPRKNSDDGTLAAPNVFSSAITAFGGEAH